MGFRSGRGASENQPLSGIEKRAEAGRSGLDGEGLSMLNPKRRSKRQGHGRTRARRKDKLDVLGDDAFRAEQQWSLSAGIAKGEGPKNAESGGRGPPTGPVEPPEFSEADTVVDFELKKGQGPSGILVSSKGEPVPGVTVYLLGPGEQGGLSNEGRLMVHNAGEIQSGHGWGRKI